MCSSGDTFYWVTQLCALANDMNPEKSLIHFIIDLSERSATKKAKDEKPKYFNTYLKEDKYVSVIIDTGISDQVRLLILNEKNKLEKENKWVHIFKDSGFRLYQGTLGNDDEEKI